MTANQLIKILKGVPGDTKVYIWHEGKDFLYSVGSVGVIEKGKTISIAIDPKHVHLLEELTDYELGEV